MAAEEDARKEGPPPGKEEDRRRDLDNEMNDPPSEEIPLGSSNAEDSLSTNDVNTNGTTAEINTAILTGEPIDIMILPTSPGSPTLLGTPTLGAEGDTTGKTPKKPATGRRNSSPIKSYKALYDEAKLKLVDYASKTDTKMAKLKDEYDLLQIKYEAVVDSCNVEFKEREEILKEENTRHKKKAVDLEERHKKDTEQMKNNYEHLISEKEAILNEKISQITRLEKTNRLGHQKDLNKVRNQKRLDDDSFKSKSKRAKTGSNKNIQITVCDNIKCGKSDVDLIRCYACSKFVCEECNEVPINKLKAISKVCTNLSFSCNACIPENNLQTSESDGIGKTDVQDLREELKNKENVIKSMETAQVTLNKLIDDRNEFIKNQKTIIDSFNNSDIHTVEEDLKEARKVITLKNDELEKCRAIQSKATNEDQTSLIGKLEQTEKEKDMLCRKLDDQMIITQKAELAFTTLEKLVSSKNENIDSLKTIISQRCPPDVKSNGTLHELSEKYYKPGFQESIICLSDIALHGLVLNGLLLWIDIQRRTVTSKEWKEKALKHFTDGEISNAKSLLWDVSEEAIVGKTIARQGPSKRQSEINDIERAMDALAQHEKMPLFVASSIMMMQTPAQDTIQPGLKDIEEVVDSLMKKQLDVLVKKCDQAVSKSEQGSKKIDEVIKVLNSHESTNVQDARFPQRPEGSAANSWGASNVTVPPANIAPPIQPARNLIGRVPKPIADTTRLWNPVNPSMVLRNDSPNQTWASVAAKPAPSQINKKAQNIAPGRKENWRQNLQLLQGTAIVEGNTSGERSTQNSTDIVAYNVGKNVTVNDMGYWLSQRGVQIIDCQLLTTSNEARTLAYKITVDAKDHERVTQDASLWPYGVGIRLYKIFDNKRQEMRYGEMQQRPAQTTRDAQGAWSSRYGQYN